MRPQAANLLAEPAPAPALRGVVATASSAGGLQALMVVLAALPAEFPAAVVIVQHLDPRQPSMMVPLLARHTALRVRRAAEGDQLESATVYVAPPDHHVVVNPNGTLSLTTTEPVQHVRPSADVLFESVARTFGAQAAAVVLSGTGRDGANGSRAIKRGHGLVIAQDEATSTFAGMPQAARLTGSVDRVLPLEEIAGALVAWAGGKS